MSDNLVLTDATLDLVMALMPNSPICGVLLRVREDDTYLATLATSEVREIGRALDTPLSRVPLAARAALQRHGDELRRAVDRVGLGSPGYCPVVRQTVPVVMAMK